MRKVFTHAYHDIISLENLLCAWQEFVKGKRKREDVQEFELHLMQNIVSLHTDLKNKTYHHGTYHAFNISDPKPRNIHKATVRDRLLHHAIYRILYPFFDSTFIAHSYSCRKGKGVHKALNTFRSFSYQMSCNNTKTVWVLKCDIRKFFATIDHDVLLFVLGRYIPDTDIFWLLSEVIESFQSSHSTLFEKKGLPLGNLTSQLLVNIYMNEFDQFIKHKLRARYYIRYADDFVIMRRNKNHLHKTLRYIVRFLRSELKLELHSQKVSIETLASGIDFLGWVHFFNHRVLRTVTKRRMLKRIQEKGKGSAAASYLGLLSHGNTKKLQKYIVSNMGIN